MIKRDRGRIGAVRGTTTMRRISAPPIATGTIRTTGTTISGFVAPVLLRGGCSYYLKQSAPPSRNFRGYVLRKVCLW